MRTALATLLVSVLLAPAASAVEVPSTMSFQAYLTDRNGSPVNGDVEVIFRMFRDETGDSEFWAEEQTISVSGGIFIAGMGSGRPLPLDQLDPAMGAVFLQVTVNGDVLGPRAKLHSVAYAMFAGNALSESEIRDALAPNLAPDDCTDAQTVGWDAAVGAWVCRDPASQSGESVTVAVEPNGANCAAGGISASVGDTTNYVCNGENGANGDSVLVQVEDAGDNCSGGGVRIEVGGAIQYVCHGAKGDPGDSVTVTPEASGGGCGDLAGAKLVVGDGEPVYVCGGVQGDTGPQGDKGDKGDTGDTGDAGESVVVTAEASGGGCGDLTGVKVEVGGVANYVCKGDTGDIGPKGDTGDTGPKGDQGDPGDSVVLTPEAAGGHCGDLPGAKLVVGDGNPVYVCEGAVGATGSQGEKGDTGEKGDAGESVSVTTEPAGGGCGAVSGVKVEVGGVASYVCKGEKGDTGDKGEVGETGQKGDTGEKGDAGDSVVMASAPLTNCATGGVQLTVGNGAPMYVCSGAKGETGATGSVGPTGEKGATGDTGPAGESVVIATEAKGTTNCDGNGGLKLTVGSNGAPTYVCNGADGAGGGGHLLRKTLYDPGSTVCTYGGQRLEWGPDAGDMNGALDNGEVIDSMDFCNAAPAICSTDIVATNQAAIDALSVCLSEITGSLQINGSGITNLNALSQLKRVNGQLAINSSGLANLDDLSNLEYVGGRFYIANAGSNPNLTDITGLGSLKTVIGALQLYAGGTDFSAFTSLTTIDGGISMYNNTSNPFTSFNGLQGFTKLKINNIANNVASFAGLENLTELSGGTYSFGSDPSCNCSCNTGNMLITDLSPLAGLTVLDVNLTFNENPPIDGADLAQLSNVKTLGGITWYSCSGAIPITDISGLQPTKITGSVNMAINNSLTGLASFFSGVTEVGGDLQLYPTSTNGSMGVSDLSLFGNLVTIGQKLVLRNFGSPTNFSGMSQLQSIGGGYSPGYTGAVVDLYQSDSSGGITNYCGLTSLSSVNGRWRKHDNSYIDDPVATIGLPTGACP